MNSKLIFVAGIVIGGVAGVLGTKEYFKKKESERADKEIASVREVWANRKPVEAEKSEETEKEEEPVAKTEPKWNKPDLTSYSSIVRGNGYSYPERDRSDRKLRPYVISPDEFGDREDDGYDSISLTYYLDGTLAEGNDIIENIDEVIGLTSLNHFGEYEDDSVFVRNDELKCDYEVLLDQRSFKDAMK
jgi:hypothetical protein